MRRPQDKLSVKKTPSKFLNAEKLINSNEYESQDGTLNEASSLVLDSELCKFSSQGSIVTAQFKEKVSKMQQSNSIHRINSMSEVPILP